MSESGRIEVRESERARFRAVDYFFGQNPARRLQVGFVSLLALSAGLAKAAVIAAIAIPIGFLLRRSQIDRARSHIAGGPHVLFRARAGEISKLPFSPQPRIPVTRECVLRSASRL